MVAYAYPLSSRMSLAPSLLVGGAEAHWRKGFFNGMMGDWRRDDDHTTSLVMMPGTSLNYTLAPWLRAIVGAHYRFVAAGESHALDQKDMRGFAGSFGFRLGRFQPVSGS